MWHFIALLISGGRKGVIWRGGGGNFQLSWDHSFQLSANTTDKT